MKTGVLLFLLLLIISAAAAAIPLSSNRYTREDIEELILAIVPAEYVDAFLAYTGMDENPDKLRMQLLAIGKVESGWTKTKSDNLNRNKSHDLGYLMLNSFNINNPKFMTRFGPLEEYPAQDKLELYLITCIRFYQYLCRRYGYENSIAIYNAGETQYIRHNIPLTTQHYVARVHKYLSEYTDALIEIARTNETIRRQHNAEKIIPDMRYITVAHRITIPVKYRSCNRRRVIVQSIREFVKRREKEINT
ncbi:MAG: hypothetical protein LBS86_05080 [Treponema sp.]|nr:hypothetical protein [Treponema sp.]